MNFFELVSKIWVKYWRQFLLGVGNTMLIALVSTLIGLLIGLAIGVIRTTPKSKNPVVRVLQKCISGVFAAYIEILRGTPMMVQAMVIYWGYAFMANGQTLPLIPSAIFIVSVNTGAYMAEIVRGGIISVDKGQYEGAASIGMSHVQTMIHVVIPQVLKNILPSISNEFVINIKDTSVLNVIGVAELFYQTHIVAKNTFEIFATYAIVCVVYFVLTFTVTRILRLCERLLEGKKNYTICGSQSDPRAQIKVKGD